LAAKSKGKSKNPEKTVEIVHNGGIEINDPNLKHIVVIENSPTATEGD
jgi:hypothetical protein